MSAGGHLSLMLGTASDEGDAQAKDPLLRVSDRVQAVVAFVAPTDLRGIVWSVEGHSPQYDQFPALDLSVEEAAKVSPLLHVSSDDPPRCCWSAERMNSFRSSTARISMRLSRRRT